MQPRVAGWGNGLYLTERGAGSCAGSASLVGLGTHDHVTEDAAIEPAAFVQGEHGPHAKRQGLAAVGLAQQIALCAQGAGAATGDRRGQGGAGACRRLGVAPGAGAAPEVHLPLAHTLERRQAAGFSPLECIRPGPLLFQGPQRGDGLTGPAHPATRSQGPHHHLHQAPTWCFLLALVLVYETQTTR